MGMVTRLLVDSTIDWPMDNTRILMEDNIGDDEPIHFHIMNSGFGGVDTYILRLHFTYDEFKEFSGAVLSGGKL